MSEVWLLSGFAVLGAVLTVVLRRVNRDISLLCAAAAGFALLIFAFHHVSDSLHTLRSWAADAGMTDESLAAVLRMLGAALAVEFASLLCRDLGEEGLARKVLICGQWLLLSMTLPALIDLGDMLFSMLPKG